MTRARRSPEAVGNRGSLRTALAASVASVARRLSRDLVNTGRTGQIQNDHWMYVLAALAGNPFGDRDERPASGGWGQAVYEPAPAPKLSSVT